MNFLNLYYFCITAEELNFTKAAKRLFITQQSLSDHISRLESECEMALFYRARPLSLTPAGEILYKNGKTILNQKMQTEKILHDIKGSLDSELSIGVDTYYAPIVLPRIIQIFHNKYPQTKYKLIEGSQDQLAEFLHEGKIDVYIGLSFNGSKDVIEQDLFVDELVFVVPQTLLTDQVRQFLTNKSIDEFDICHLIKMCSDSWLCNVFNECFHDYAVNCNHSIILQTHDINTLIAMCVSGFGATILSNTLVLNNPLLQNSIVESSIVTFPLCCDKNKQTVSISYPSNRYITRIVTDFVQAAVSAYQ